jgi:hypothetical protein
MRFPVLRTGLTVAAAVFALVFLVAALPICSHCGYEGAEGDAACGHCGAELPPPPEAPETPAATNPPPEAAQAEALEPGVVDAEIRAAQACAAKGESRMAYLLARNALALNRVTADERGARRGAAILALLGDARAQAGGAARRCDVCGGSGRGKTRLQRFDGGSVEMATQTALCDACGGTGAVEYRGTVADSKRAMGEAVRQFDTWQQTRQRTRVGNAWVPMAFADRMSVRQTALLMCTAAAPCPECAGFGRSDCERCAGLGSVRCPVRGCVDGRVEKKREGELIKTGRTERARCDRCKGRGRVACELCRARGWQICEACNGSGDRPLCATCAGRGFSNCRRCGGSGQRGGADCAVCDGGAVLCRACGGDGRRK